MKYILCTFSLMVCGILAWAAAPNGEGELQRPEEILREIAYYEKDFSGGSGNVEYRNLVCKLDLYLPERGKEKFPTVVWLHGGGMTAGEKDFPETLKNSKIAIAAVEYRFSNEQGSCPDYLEDAAAATAWVLTHIEEYGGDAELVFLAGHSAGGYLTAMVGMDEKYLAMFGRKPLELAGLFPISGEMTTHFQILNERKKRGEKVGTKVIDEYAPIYHAQKEVPPLELYVGDPTIEWPARVEDNYFFAAVLTRVAGHEQTHVTSFAGCDHGQVLYPAIEAMKISIAEKCRQRTLTKVEAVTEK